MAPNRTLLRNVIFCDGNKPDDVLGGFRQNGAISKANFLDILEIVLDIQALISVQERTSRKFVWRRNVPLQSGVYDIFSKTPLEVSQEEVAGQPTTEHKSKRTEKFRREVRDRDQKCVISGLINPEGHMRADIWCDFQAAHIVPLQYESIWEDLGFGELVSVDTPGRSKINSPQNGLLLDSAIHTRFDQYLISINPDDNYKIVAFDLHTRGLDGRILDPVCRKKDDPHRVQDALLKWHYRQSILTNVRGK